MNAKPLTSVRQNALLIAGGFVIALSLLVITGWLIGSEALVQIYPQFASMKFNTALGFLIAGSAIILQQLRHINLVVIFSSLLVVLALFSLLEWLVPIDLGIDNFFIQDWTQDSTAPPGRMSIPTAVCFILSGVGFLLLSIQAKKVLFLTLVSILAGVILSIGIIGVIDYTLSIFTDYGWQQYTVMAFHTTSSFCLIGISLMFMSVSHDTNREQQFNSGLIPLTTVLLMGCLTISIAIENKNQQHAKTILTKQLNEQLGQIKQELNFTLTALNQTAKRWDIRQGNINQLEWQQDSQINLDTSPYLESITKIDLHFKPHWSVFKSDTAAQTEANKLIKSLNHSPSQMMRISLINTKFQVDTLAFSVPLYVANQYDGFILATFNAKSLFNKVAKLEIEESSWLDIYINDTLFFSTQSHDLPFADKIGLQREITLYGLDLRLVAGYANDDVLHGLGLLSSTVFISGCLLVFILVVLINTNQRSRHVLSRSNQERERFRLIIEAAPGAMLLTSNEGKIELINSKTEQLFGYQHKEIIGQNVDILVPFEQRRNHTHLRKSYEQAPRLRAMAKGEELYGLHKSGQLVPVEIELCPIRTDQGLKILASIFDLTERTKQLRELKRSKNELDRAGRIAKIGAWQFDYANNVVHWSSQTYAIHEVPESVPISLEFSRTFYTETEKNILQAAIDEASKNGTEWDLELPLTTLQGKNIWIRTQGQVEYENGQPARLVGAIQDITERRLANLELERSNQELNNFAYIASHDLKSPLRGIDQLATWLTEDLGDTLPAKSKEHLSLMRSRIDRMENLLDDLLSYARAGRKDAALEKVELHSFIEHIFSFCNITGRFTLTLRCETAKYNLARSPLELVLRNLINNAIKHHDQAQGLIDIECKYLNNHLIFVVADDGPGIPEDMHERAFAMFQTLKPRDKVEGSGMGLAIVKKVIESFDGQISLKDNKPHGARFEFSWPAQVMF